MLRLGILTLTLLAATAAAEDKRVDQTDKYGNIQYHKPSLVVKDGKLVQYDSYGIRQPLVAPRRLRASYPAAVKIRPSARG